LGGLVGRKKAATKRVRGKREARRKGKIEDNLKKCQSRLKGGRGGWIGGGSEGHPVAAYPNPFSGRGAEIKQKKQKTKKKNRKTKENVGSGRLHYGNKYAIRKPHEGRGFALQKTTIGIAGRVHTPGEGKKPRQQTKASRISDNVIA